MATEKYSESKSHKPDPTAMRGTLPTHGRTGMAGTDLTAVSDAYADDRRRAAQAIADGEANVLTDSKSEQSAQDQEDALKEKAEQDLKDLEEAHESGLSDSERAAAQENDDAKAEDDDKDDAAATTGTKSTTKKATSSRK